MTNPPRHSSQASTAAHRHDVEPSLDELAAARTFVGSVLADLGPDQRLQMVGAVDEIVTNAVEAHRRRGVGDAVVISWAPHARQFTVSDHGGGYQPHGVAASPDGRGLLIARSLVPDLRWSVTSSGTTWAIPVPHPAANAHTRH